MTKFQYRRSMRLNTKANDAKAANFNAGSKRCKGLLLLDYSKDSQELPFGTGHAVFWIPKLKKLYNFCDYQRKDDGFKRDGYAIVKYTPPAIERPLSSRKRPLEDDDPSDDGMCCLVSKSMSFLYYNYFKENVQSFEEFLLTDSVYSKDVVRLAIQCGMKGISSI